MENKNFSHKLNKKEESIIDNRNKIDELNRMNHKLGVITIINK